MIAANALACLLMEIATWPKPGLVSHVDNGSHDDMDADMFRASASAIAPYFSALAEAGGRGAGMGRLREIGLEAEMAMFAATSGVNTHRGAIFGMGLLCAAAGARAAGVVSPARTLGATVSSLWGESIIDGPVLLHSNGSHVRRRYGAGGARMEAALGFPSVYEIGLPRLRLAAGIDASDAEAIRVEACFSLIAVVEDTNLLHRGGRAGLAFARAAARAFIRQGGIARPGWRDHALHIHESFVTRRLSPGGSADLLAMSLFVESWEREQQW
ncbi:triphosphoribosyl-dephospho-CoA synthase MdcB [Martelella soudanensis]|uniref:triphosphoribosyl-dephospho-CoA synthase MdcB n=1 Tax=unclassified Martelella TaxID=2629616 RepID=UPI001FEFFFDD|nr:MULTISPECIES: triphosphoribosyl-dephospho-CoA synthase MdcB [unclassified Martelella]